MNMKQFKKAILNFSLIMLLSVVGIGKMQAQLIVTDASSMNGWTADSLVRNILLDNGVTISDARFNGSTGVVNCNSIGKFETGSTPTNLGMESGLIIASGGVSVAVGPNNSDGLNVATTCGSYSDPQLSAIATGTTYDVAVLEFDFVPWDDTLTFSFVFGSEEYLEYVNSQYNDVFGFFVDGANPNGGVYNHQNMALIPGTNEVVSINTVHSTYNSQYYINNAGGATIQFDGFTTLLEVCFAVVPMTTYHIKLAICDVSDHKLDSGVFLEAHSFTTNFSYGMMIDDMLYSEIPDNQYFCSNHSIEFNTVTDWNYDDVTWYFGDGTSAQGEQVSHTYSEDGFYTVTNVLHNPHRSTDSLYISKEIEVRSFSSEQEVTICDGPYSWNGQTYTQSGDYIYQGQSFMGCDSIVTLHLTVNSSSTNDLYVTSCDTYQWYGQNYSQSGTYQHMLQTAAGCDSLLVLHLEINPIETTYLNITACEQYVWYGTTYTQSGTYQHVEQTSAGCDSLLILNLNIANEYIEEFNVNSCYSYTWRGDTYTESGTYTDTGTNPNGCDSTFVLHLTIGQDQAVDTSAFSCESLTWYGQTYTETGDYTHLLHTWIGCDSLVTLHLTIGNTIEVEETAEGCNSYYWRGHTYTTGGTYTDVGHNPAGCDTLLTLHLTMGTEMVGDTTSEECGPIVWYGQVCGETGDYTHMLQTVMGCDSLVTLHYTKKFTPNLRINGLTQVAMTSHYGPFYVYFIADSLELSTCDVTWTCSNQEWVVAPGDNPYMCKIAPVTLGQATLTATAHCLSGCDTISNFEINASHYGVEENGEGGEALLFPNPADDKITVQAHQMTRIRMLNGFGQAMKEESYDQTETATIDVGDLPKGIYIVEITTTYGKTKRLLIIQ